MSKILRAGRPATTTRPCACPCVRDPRISGPRARRVSPPRRPCETRPSGTLNKKFHVWCYSGGIMWCYSRVVLFRNFSDFFPEIFSKFFRKFFRNFSGNFFEFFSKFFRFFFDIFPNFFRHFSEIFRTGKRLNHK